MQLWFEIILLTLMAGLAMPLGGFIASIDAIRPNWINEEYRHSVTAFGGGALLSAVALVLVPEGIKPFAPVMGVCLLLLGGLMFMGIDIFLYRHNTSAAQLIAMLADFIPESIALGASIALGKTTTILLAVLIGMQNLPEGFNAFRELKATTRLKSSKIIYMFMVLASVGPISGLMAYFWLVEHESVISGIMLMAAGGILYAVFQDIAPQVKLEKHWAPPLGAVMGFALGMLGYMLSI